MYDTIQFGTRIIAVWRFIAMTIESSRVAQYTRNKQG